MTEVDSSTRLPMTDVENAAVCAADYPISPVPMTAVAIADDFWSRRIETNRTATVPYAFEKSEETGRVRNFELAADVIRRRAAGETTAVAKPATGLPFDDSDVFKIIEGAAFVLAAKPDPQLETYVDGLIAKIAAAQEADGYLYTFRSMNPEEPQHPWIDPERWKKSPELSHELYNIGHLYEAAFAWWQATGKRNLLDIAVLSAELVVRDLGPGGPGIVPGHQVIEMGLAKLYRATGDRRFLDQAKTFLDLRGPDGDAYSQAHRRPVDQDAAVGHAVRAGYMYAGMADVAALAGDAAYLAAIDRIWDDVVCRKFYLTGGIGARHAGEAFGDAYELPNMSAYCETCAAIANVYWNHRLFLMHGHAKYIDVLERSLYNNVLSGISLDGKAFFYPNPLLSMGQHHRSAWFGCSCCPSNLARFMASVGGYQYACEGTAVYVNLYAAGRAVIPVGDGRIILTQQTRYPWNGTVDLAIDPEGEPREFVLCLRIPGWARNRPVPSDLYRYIDGDAPAPVIRVNGESVPVQPEKGYARIRRTWHPGDRITLELPMPVRRVVSHEAVEENRGAVALERGPLVYCLEWPDNPEGHVLNLVLPDDRPLNTEEAPELLDGVTVITGDCLAAKETEAGSAPALEPRSFRAIPYYGWAHRGTGEMTVWVPRDPAGARPLPKPTLASRSTSRISGDREPAMALSDRLMPANSNDHSMPYIHWWPRKGTVEWVEYEFPEPASIHRVRAYWFDDEPWGGCRVPASWRVLVRRGEAWEAVETDAEPPTAKDCFCEAAFASVETTGVRVEIVLQQEWAGGLLELAVE